MKTTFKKYFSPMMENKVRMVLRYGSFIGIGISVLMLYGVWEVSNSYFYHQAQNQFKHHALEHYGIIERRLGRYENTLRGGIGLLIASDRVSREEWHRYVAAVDPKAHNPGMQGIGYAVMLSADELDRFENDVRRSGYTSFEITPSYPRERYSTILYLEPLDERNRAAIGFDMYSEPVRREAMQRAAETGDIAFSGKVTLLQEIDENIQSGILIYLPYYASVEPPKTLEERRQTLNGYVYAPIRMGDFTEAITSHRDLLRVEIYDGEEVDEKNLLYRPRGLSTFASKHHHTVRLPIAGRVWTIRYSSTPVFDATYSSSYPMVLALMGLILYLGLLYIIIEFIKSRFVLNIKTKALLKEKEKAQNYLDIVDAMVLVLDNEYRIRVINRKGSKVLGYPPEEAIGENFVDLFIPHRLRDDLLEVGRRIVDENGCEYYENPIVTKGGEERLVAWRNRQLIDEEGRVIGVLSAGEDITEIRQAQEKLQESEAFYRTLFESIKEAIVVLHEDRVTDCNDLALILFDVTREAFIGESIFETAYEIECPDYPLDHHLRSAFRGETVSTRCTLRLHRNPNVIKIVEFSFSRFGSESQHKLVMISRDITRQVEEEKLFTLHARQAQMGEMISMIAHQWRQPLAIINAITTQMRLKAMLHESEDEEFIDNLTKIERQSSHLSQTISDYRDFFRPDKPKERFLLLSLVDHALTLIDHALKNHSIRIENKGGCNPTLYTYRNELLQVLIALFKNALDAFIDNKVIGGEIVIGVESDKGDCTLTIRDNAGGIPSAVMYKLFTPYFTTKSDNAGTGLGLYMSRMIIEDHCGGSIHPFSEGKTTIFQIKLPCEERA
jgi:PAS domain S-box-containing protein